MKRSVLIATAVVAGLAGALLTLLVLGVGPSAAADGSSPTGDAATRAAAFCTSVSDGSGSFHREMEAASARMHRGMAIVPSGDPDRDFAGLMIPHHQGAIDMALVQLKYGRDRRLRRLAQSIVAEQTQEIAYMRALLDAPLAAVSIPTDNSRNQP